MPRKSKKDIEGLEMVVTIVSKGKGDCFKKIYNKVESSCQASLFGMGTADSAMLGLFGLADIEKDVILALIKKSYIDQLFTILDSELEMHGKGIAFSVPLTGVVGKSLYEFLINRRGEEHGK